jgi:hypothetical protein
VVTTAPRSSEAGGPDGQSVQWGTGGAEIAEAEGRKICAGRYKIPDNVRLARRRLGMASRVEEASTSLAGCFRVRPLDWHTTEFKRIGIPSIPATRSYPMTETVSRWPQCHPARSCR